MTTQQKINTGLILAILLLGSLLFWANHSRETADAEVRAAATRAEVAVARFRADSARLAPIIRKLNTELETVKETQKQLQIKVLLNTKRNENLYKQLDSVDAVLGIRPRF